MIPTMCRKSRAAMAMLAFLGLAAGAAAQDAPLLSAAPKPPPPASRRAAAASGLPSVLHRLSAGPQRLRFEGETDNRTFTIFLTGAQASTHARVHLRYSNAVSVMSEASHLQVSVNDVVVADTALVSSAADGPAVLDADVPDSVLAPGYNAVRIAVQQRHRVDCSTQATYELWTQLDPAETGLAFAGISQEAITDLSDLPALAPDSAGRPPLRVIVSKGVDTTGLDRILRGMEAVVLRGNLARPAIQIEQAPIDEPGLDLLVGTFDELQQAGFADLATGGPVSFHTGTRSGQSTLVITGATGADIDAEIMDVVKGGAADDQLGTVAGLRAVALRGTVIRDARTISFRDLGLTTEEFSGRLFRAGFDLLLPPDFYAEDYGKMTLRIDAGYVAGLDPSSQILVRVNDRDAASLSLRNPHGDVFRGHPITVSLADLRPGFNHVQIEAQLSVPADKACDVKTMIDGKTRFVLLDESRLEMPDVARIAHMPSLSATAGSGFPYVAADAETRLYIPHPDADVITAVANLMAREAHAAGAPLPIKIVVSNPGIDASSAIIVGALNDLPPAMVEQVGIDAAKTKDIWSNIEAKSKANMRLNQDGAPSGEEQRASIDSALYQKWSANTPGTWYFDPIGWVGSALGTGIGLTSQSLSPWGRIEERFVPDWHARLIVAQHGAPSGGGATWTLVTAPTGELLSQNVDLLTAASMWNQLDARIAALDPASKTLTIVRGSQGYFIKTAALSPGNIRLIAAGWLSSYLEYYVLALVVLSLCLGFTTTAVVRRSGVKQ